MREPPRPLLGAFLRTLRSRATYDVRRNVGLWLGFVLSLPIPVLAISLSASPYVVLAALLAPFGWGVTVGAAWRVGTISDEIVRGMRLEALADARTRDQTYADLRAEATTERTERHKVEQLLRVADAELALAEVIHQSLISPSLRRGAVDVAIRHVPHAFVGGDYVQAVLPRSDLLYLCVGDVAGHGVAAALVVSRIHGLVQRLIVQEAGPAAILEELDRAARLLLAHTMLFITFAIFRIDLPARNIEYATAGHPPQLLRRAAGGVDELSTQDGLLGMQLTSPRSKRSVGHTTYEIGDTLLLFTDGLFEAREAGDRGEMWGEGSLKALFAKVGSAAPDAVAGRILQEVKRFGGLRPSEDDVTLLVARLGAGAGLVTEHAS